VSDRLVVVGGDAAGMSAASQARRLAPDLEIVAFERGNHVSYSACGEPYFVAGIVPTLERLVARRPAEFARRGIDVRLRSEVKEIDLDRRTVKVRDAAGGASAEWGFDHLMYATGSAPLRPTSIEGIDDPAILGLRTLDDAAALKQRVDGGRGRAVVVGGGYIGIEVAEALVARHWEVTMVTSGPHVLEKTLDPEIGDAACQAVRAYGVNLMTGALVERVERDGDRFRVAGADFAVEGDLVFIGLGTTPEVELAAAAGIPLGGTGAVAVDNYQRTSIEGVWAGGDCAEVSHRLTGRQVNIMLGTVANKTGRIAGTNIAGGGPTPFPGVLGTAITKIGEAEIARTGLTTIEARAAGYQPVTGLVMGTTTAGYWPGAAPMKVMLVADRASGRLLGGQIVGGAGAGKRIDVIAAAIWNGMTASELAWVDLAYAPPFGGVWDLVLIAARRAADDAG
jgi:NADPH-dependent 2,4-dienoyl-CoA reductase/sulfur reductase-like enzyme